MSANVPPGPCNMGTGRVVTPSGRRTAIVVCITRQAILIIHHLMLIIRHLIIRQKVIIILEVSRTFRDLQN